MPSLEDKGKKFRRRCLYFAASERGKPRNTKMLAALRKVCENGRAGVVCHTVSPSKVDLRWPRAVTWDSPVRVCTPARELCPRFEILEEPHGVESDAEKRTEETPEAHTAPPKKRRKDKRTDGPEP